MREHVKIFIAFEGTSVHEREEFFTDKEYAYSKNYESKVEPLGDAINRWIDSMKKNDPNFVITDRQLSTTVIGGPTRAAATIHAMLVISYHLSDK